MKWICAALATTFLVCTPVSAQEQPQRTPEATSLLGKALYPPKIPAERQAKLEKEWVDSRTALAANPENVDALIMVARRMAYLGNYRDAIQIYSHGLTKWPNNPKLLRHRGHRFLTVREPEKAIVDLEAAAKLVRGKPDEIEPDGQPNAKNIPRGTLQTNIWYHVGLAYYVRGDFTAAARAFGECLALSKNDDMAVAARYWLYLSQMRNNRRNEATQVLAPVQATMDILENDGYHKLLLLYKGSMTPEEVLALMKPDDVSGPTILYGVAMWQLFNGRQAESAAMIEKIVASEQWPAFGVLAAESELAKGRRK